MRWFGVGLMMASTVVGLVAWYGFDANRAVTIGAGVFFIIGLVAFLGSRERKASEKIENIHTDKKE